MSFTSSGVIKGAAISLLLGILILGGLWAFGVIGRDASPEDPAAALARTAKEALEAVRRRQPGDRRPASYDAVMTPLDRMLARAKTLLEGENYDPVGDAEKVRFLATQVIEIADQADRQAKSETSHLAKDYRFNDQKGEASQYLATALWERMNAKMTSSPDPLSDAPAYPRLEMEEIRRVLDAGLVAAPQNRDLWMLRGMVNRADGLFAPAARDLEKAIGLDPEYAMAWNTLGLVRISLKEFDQAEDAYEKAKALLLEQARRFNLAGPGPEYVSVIYNLASFHENLAAFYNRENRVTPTVESRRLLDKHAAEARKYLEEFLRLEPDGPDAQSARSRLNALPL